VIGPAPAYERGQELLRSGELHPPKVPRPLALDVDLLTADLAETAVLVRGVTRIATPTIRIEGEPLDVYRSVVGTLVLTRQLASKISGR